MYVSSNVQYSNQSSVSNQQFSQQFSQVLVSGVIVMGQLVNLIG